MAAVTLAALLSSGAVVGSFPSPALREATAPTAMTLLDGSSSPSPLYLVSGTVRGFGSPPVPLAGVHVSVSSQSCAGAPSATTCTALGSTVTNASGAFSFSVSNGSYFVYSDNTSRWGGDSSPVTVAGHGATIGLVAYPWVVYDNATEVLPHWNSLAAYAANCNAPTPCLNGGYGAQVPLLAWTQDGAFYVNATDELVFDSFATGRVTAIAPWQPLYQNLMSYDGVENTEWITVDGSFVYTVGCLTLCQNSSGVTVYAVNVTTGAAFEYTYANVIRGNLFANAQLDLIGRGGNHSVAALITSDGVIHAYGLWNRTQWTLGALPYFEANNVYWVPPLDSYIDVEAQGSSHDRLSQFLLTGAGAGDSLRSVYSATYAGNYESNGVDGLYLNLTSRDLLLTESSQLGNVSTQRFGWNANGILTGEGASYASSPLGAWPGASAPPNPISSEHRPGLASETPFLMGFWDGFFDNNSWLFEPNSGTFYDTNLPMSPAASGGEYRQAGIPPSAVEGLSVNTTYEIVEESVNCRQPSGACPIEGTSGGSGPGTVWWAWRLGAPEFPFPADAPLAQTTGPGPVTGLAATALSNSVRVSWRGPSTGAFPLLNYTVFWSPSGSGTTLSASLPASARDYRIDGLPPATEVDYEVVAWNLHGSGVPSGGSISTTPAPPLIQNFSADVATIALGMPLRLSASIVSSLVSPSVGYSGLPPGCPGSTGPVLVCVPTSAGEYAVTVTVTDPENQTDQATVLVTVDPGPALVTIAGPTVWESGRPVPLSATVLNGWTIPPAGYRWEVDGTLSGPGPSQVAPVLLAPGPHVVDVEVTDGQGHFAWGATLVSIYPPLEVSLRINPQPAAPGEPVNLTAEVVGPGTPPLTFRWSNGVAGVPYQTVTFAAVGAYALAVTVDDAAGAEVNATGTVVVETVPLALTVSFGHGGFTDVGHPVDLTVDVAGSATPFAFVLDPAPFACSSTQPTAWTCDPPLPGNYEFGLSVTDAAGVQETRTATLTVEPSPSASLGLNTTGPAYRDRPFDWLIVANGGSAPLTFTFDGLPSGCPTPSGANLSCTIHTLGSFGASVQVEDALGLVAGASTTFDVVPPPILPPGPIAVPLGTGVIPGAVLAWLVPGVTALLTAAAMGGALRPPPSRPRAGSVRGPPPRSPPPVTGGSPGR